MSLHNEDKMDNFAIGAMELKANWNTRPDQLKVPWRKSTIRSLACNSAAGFAQFTSGPKPTWFKRSSILLETEDWMRASVGG